LGMYFEPYALAMKVGFVAIVLGIGYYLNRRYARTEKLGVTDNE